MIEREHYLNIVKKYGHCASWAVWEDADEKPKSNVGDLQMFDLQSNQHILEQLNPNIVMVGLNISRRIGKTFGNFHDSRPQAQDYKIRYAFKGSKYYGAYMTDIIKDFDQKISGKVMRFLIKNKSFEQHNIGLFKEELYDIKSLNPLIIAFGTDVFNILNKYFRDTHTIVKLPHYSSYISKEDYKAQVENRLAHIGNEKDGEWGMKEADDKKITIQILKREVAQFVKDRDWEQFHSPKNLSMSIAIEAAELMEHFQWLTNEQSKDLLMKQLKRV